MHDEIDEAAFIRAMRAEGQWPQVVPPAVLAECLTGHPGRDAMVNRLLKACSVPESFPEALGRRAGALRTRARRGSGIDAIVVAFAEPGGTVLTSDADDIRALTARATDVEMKTI